MAVVINEIEVTPEAKQSSSGAPQSGKPDLPENLIAQELEKTTRRAAARVARLVAD